MLQTISNYLPLELLHRCYRASGSLVEDYTFSLCLYYLPLKSVLRFTCLQNYNLCFLQYLYTVQRNLSQDMYKNNKFIN